MKTDLLQQYVELRAALLNEKAELEAQLGHISSALGEEAPVSAPVPVVRRGRPSKAAVSEPMAEKSETGSGRGGRRVRRKLSLRRAVIQVTTDNPLTKQLILDAVKKIGYKFGAANPLPSLNAVLYGSPKFTNDDGRFSPPA